MPQIYLVTVAPNVCSSGSRHAACHDIKDGQGRCGDQGVVTISISRCHRLILAAEVANISGRFIAAPPGL